MTYSDWLILLMPARCLTDRRYRHAWLRALNVGLTLALLRTWTTLGDIIDAE